MQALPDIELRTPGLGPGVVASTADRLAILVLVIAAALVAATFRDYGLGWDDYTHSQMGELLLALYGSGFADKRALSFVNLYMYGGGFDMAAALAAKVLPLGLFETRRLVGGLVGIVGLIATWRTARRLAGPLAGFLALVLLLTCPLYYGHMFMNAKDAPFAVAMALLTWALVRAFDEYPRPSWGTVAFVGLGLGVTIGTRVMGGMAAIYAAAALGFLVAIEARSLGLRAAAARVLRFIVRLLPAALVGYGIMGLLWPWSVIAPLNPLHAVTYFSKFFEKPWKELYDGVLIAVPDMPWTYLPTLLSLKLPEVFSVLALIGLGVAARRIANTSALPSARAAIVLVVCAAVVPVLLTILTRPALYNGVRHFLFILPPLAVLGGLAGGALLDRLRWYGQATFAAGVAVIAIGIASPAVEMIRLHPYEYTHFNRIAGGMSGAQGRFMLDYWGLSFKEAARALRIVLSERGEKPPEGRRWKVAVCGPHPPAAAELGPDFELTWNPKGADFALMLGEYYCVKVSAPILAEVTRAGVVYARAYDIRGRAVTTLFTLPPP